MSTHALKATCRTGNGKTAAKQVRYAGLIPAVLYDKKNGNVSLSISPKELTHILSSDTRMNTVIELSYEGEKSGNVHTIVKEIQRDVLSREVIHADFMVIDMNAPITVKIPVELVGAPVGVKIEGGVLTKKKLSLQVQCLPSDIPAAFTLDITNLHAGEAVRISDIKNAEKITFLEPATTEIANVKLKRVEVEAEEEYEMI